MKYPIRYWKRCRVDSRGMSRGTLKGNPMEYQDDRTDSQLRTHTVIIYGRDSFLSGWGKARGGDSYAGWACTPSNASTVKAWVKARTDIENVQSYRQGLDPILPEELVPETCKHFHVYAVGDGHPALREE